MALGHHANNDANSCVEAWLKDAQAFIPFCIDTCEHTLHTTGKHQNSTDASCLHFARFSSMKASWTASFQRNLSFLSPRTWRGIHNALKNQIPDSVITFKTISSWFYHILIPFLLLTTAIHQPYSHSKYPIGKSAQQAAVVTLLAPLTIMKTAETIPVIKTTLNRMYIWKLLRQEADQEALEILSRDRSIDLATRTSKFDIYFPTPNNLTQKNERQRAMLLIPGFLIDHTAYASIASRIALEGDIIVVVLSLEPLRVADNLLVELRDLNRCIRAATKLWNRKCGGKNNGQLEWSLGGHSYGGYAAMRLAPQLADHLNKSCTDKLKVLVWAAGDQKGFLTDLTQQANANIFVLLGTSDNFCNPDDKECQILKSYLPANTRIQFIDGGSHHNFASYSRECGKNDIARTEQHKQISFATTDFLKNQYDHYPTTEFQ